MRVLLGAFGDPGHAFPMIALGRGLRARGHEVTLQTWRALARPTSRREGMRFAPAPEYHVFPTPGAAAEALRGGRARDRRDARARARRSRPTCVVADILTLAPALAGELEGVPRRDAHPARRPAPRAGLRRRTRSARGCRGRALGPRRGGRCWTR